MTRNDVLDTLAILADQVIKIQDGTWGRARPYLSPNEVAERAHTYARAAQRFAQRVALDHPDL